MTQLVYHPAFDPYNALLRTCRVLLACGERIDPAALRILEFFLLFPENLSGMRLSAKLRAAAKKASLGPRFPYDRLPSAKTLFDRMQPSFDAAYQTLQSRGIVTISEPDTAVRLNLSALPEILLVLANAKNEEEGALMTLLQGIATEYKTAGPNGLKDRSGLQEYRYDVF